MALLTARQVVDHLATDPITGQPHKGRRAMGYRRFLYLVAKGQGPARVEFDDGKAALYDTAAVDAWVAGLVRSATERRAA